MTDDPEDKIRRLSLWEGDDLDPREFRAAMIDRWGEETVMSLEDVLLDVPSEGNGLRPANADIQTSGDATLLRSDLRSIVTTGRLHARGEYFTFRPPTDCPDAVLTGDPDLPVFENPQMLGGDAAWVDVCMPTEDWLRLMVTPFSGPKGRNLIGGLAPNSIDRVTEGLRAGETIPRGALEMERQRIGQSTFLVPVEQEGRNRGAAAFLEGYDTVVGRLVARD
jgi:hypothetical protein